MANRFAKKDIDFDVYERADPSSVVDWGKAAQDITKTFEGIRDVRQKKKAEIEKSFQDQQTALNDIGEYDNPTIQQFVMNGGQDVSNKLLDVKNLVERGLMKPSDATMWQHNAKTGFDLVKKNAKQFDKTFQEYTKRVQETGPNGFSLSSPGEVWMAKQLEGFANMNNMSLEADDQGNMVMLRTDEDGVPIPGESMSVQHMTLLMKQKIDNFDSTAALTDIKKSMGTIITAQFGGPGTTVSTEERSRAETEFFATEGGQEFLDLKTDEFLANPPGFNQQSLMVNAGLTTSAGEKYAVGSQEEYDKWNEEHPDDEDNNPVLRMVFGKDNLNRPEFNEAQTEAARAHASQMITGSLDVKQTAVTKQKTYAPQPSAASIAKTGKDKELLSKGKNLMLAVSGNEKESSAGLRYLVDASNGVVKGIQKTADGFIIQYSGTKEPYSINTEGLSPEEAMRELWKGAGLQATEFDVWLDVGGKDLLIDRKTTYDPLDIKGPQESIVYDTQATVVLNGEDVSPVDFITDSALGNSPSVLEGNTNAQYIKEYSNLLNQESFFPKGIGDAKITFDTSKRPDEMIITIGDTDYSLGDVFGQTTTETVALIQEKIQEVIAKRKTGGGGASKHNKKK